MNEQTSELKACRWFPLLRCGGFAIPWDVVEPHAKQAEQNHGQTLERLAERGGLDLSELAAVLEDRRWQSMGAWPAMETIWRHITAWNTRSAPSPIVQAADEMEKALSRVCGVLRCRYTKLPIQPNDGCHCTFCDEHASALAALEHYAKVKGQ
jgi:choline dehydrogenase-like flavoprotein